MRGKQLDEEDAKIQVRITPACAGKTERSESQTGRQWDHPRVCGENTLTESLWLLGKGSPPRVRGKLRAADLFIGGLRITPACAGKTADN